MADTVDDERPSREQDPPGLSLLRDGKLLPQALTPVPPAPAPTPAPAPAPPFATGFQWSSPGSTPAISPHSPAPPSLCPACGTLKLQDYATHFSCPCSFQLPKHPNCHTPGQLTSLCRNAIHLHQTSKCPNRGNETQSVKFHTMHGKLHASCTVCNLQHTIV